MKDTKYYNFENLMEKKDNIPNIGNGIYLKIAGYVDLNMQSIFAISTWHLSCIGLEIKDEQH